MKFFLFFSLFLFSQCKSKEDSIEKKIIGTWEIYEVKDIHYDHGVPCSGGQDTYFKDFTYSDELGSTLNKGVWFIKIIDKKPFLVKNTLSYNNGAEGEFHELANKEWIYIQKHNGNVINVTKDRQQIVREIQYIDNEKLILSSDIDGLSSIYRKK